jgi:alpha-glucosidase
MRALQTPLLTTIVAAIFVAAAPFGMAQQSGQPLAKKSSDAKPYATNQVQSPDGKVVVNFLMQDGGMPSYKIDYLGKPVVLQSRLGLEPDFTAGFQVTGTSSKENKGQWTQAFGERKIVPDNYRELNVDLKHLSGWLMRITFRAYNEGAALRYSFPEQAEKELKFTGERTEFRFPEDTYAYEEHATEGEYKRVKTGDIEPWCERPLTLEYAGGLFACLAEADNERYPRMLLSPLPGVPGALVSALGGTTANTVDSRQRHDPNVKIAPPASTPWRMFVVGQKPGDLLERNYLMLNLNPPCAIKDTTWIKPGKVMRDTALTTENSKAIIDFAEKAGLQYVSLDWKWYGSEDPDAGDATTVRAPNLDIPEIIRYGAEKNVGLIVYVDRRQIKKQRDILFPLYEKWGIKGVKIGFVDVGPQEETAWITETIQKAAEHRLMLNIHDGYRPTGLARTYPNLMTVEGIRGNEHFPTPEHNCTLPFTRYIAGSADYTVCYYDKRIKPTHAHQLAMAVVSFSPLQWIFWYDKPSLYKNEPEIEFFRHVPTVWDDTKVLNGEIGRYATIARRSGDDWFIGTINGSEKRQLEIFLDFLAPGKNYIAHIYSDDDSATTRTKVGIETRPVDTNTIIEADLSQGGGQAVWITPGN